MEQATAGAGSILFAGLIGLVSIGTFVATLTLVNRGQQNPAPPYVPLTPERKRLVKDIDARTTELQRGGKLLGFTFHGDRIEGVRISSRNYVLKVGSKKYSYEYAQDVAAHFVALDATRLAVAA